MKNRKGETPTTGYRKSICKVPGVGMGSYAGSSQGRGLDCILSKCLCLIFLNSWEFYMNLQWNMIISSPPHTSPIFPHQQDPLRFQLFFESPLSSVSASHMCAGLGPFITWSLGTLLVATSSKRNDSPSLGNRQLAEAPQCGWALEVQYRICPDFGWLDLVKVLHR